MDRPFRRERILGVFSFFPTFSTRYRKIRLWTGSSRKAKIRPRVTGLRICLISVIFSVTPYIWAIRKKNTVEIKITTQAVTPARKEGLKWLFFKKNHLDPVFYRITYIIIMELRRHFQFSFEYSQKLYFPKVKNNLRQSAGG